ncbi:MAG: phosphotransferase [Bacteroidales bacterium]|nr:MAG: phosphotransferase [Bacteroidales bacterium]
MPETTSGRKYYRLQAGEASAIGVYNNNKRENDAFIFLSSHLKKHDINVPDVYKVDSKKGVYLIQDLGDITLYKYLEDIRGEKNYEDLAREIYRKVIDEMPKIQIKTPEDMDFSICYPRAEFDYQSIMWDLNYFKYYFLKLAGVKFDEQYLEDDFQLFTRYLLEADYNYFLYRDFQSRNIMIKDDKLYFIDYQGGRRGALQYDLASLLFEAKTRLTDKLRQELLDYYIRINSKERSFNSIKFIKYYPAYILVRIIQAMGAYGYRGYYERKSFYLKSIPYAVRNMEWLLSNLNIGIKAPALFDCLKQIVKSEELREYEDNQTELTVSINSFSYRYGIPQDNSGNGGGFVFDCRALPNPGRYPQFSQFTGKDKPVIDFLKKEAEVKKFIDNTYSIIESSINNYKERNFTDLMVNFGCTGGKHRSVYFAERIAERLKRNFDIKIRLRHRRLEDND